MKILYLGVDSGTSKHRANAIRRLGHDVAVVTPDDYVPKGKIAAKIHYETGGLLCQSRTSECVANRLNGIELDCTLVDNGRYVGPGLIRYLRRYGPVISYNIDDPYGGRDRFSWNLYLKSVPEYDLITVLREENIHEAYACGAKKVLRLFMSADEIAHQPRQITDADLAKWKSDVCFIGTWMPERGGFMRKLLKYGVPLAIYGDRWQKSPEWQSIKSAWRGPALLSSDDYAKAIQCARISLGLLSKGNRDLHTTRSLEIPALGGLLCAERTSEHLSLYTEGEEAVFWKDAGECAKSCQTILADSQLRQRIAENGHSKCLANGHFNELAVSKILQVVFGGKN